MYRYPDLTRTGQPDMMWSTASFCCLYILHMMFGSVFIILFLFLFVERHWPYAARNCPTDLAFSPEASRLYGFINKLRQFLSQALKRIVQGMISLSTST